MLSKMNLQLLQKQNIEISKFSPISKEGNDTERTKIIKAKLQERLERIEINNQDRNLDRENGSKIKNFKVFDGYSSGLVEERENSQLVKLNKVSKGDHQQIQRVNQSELVFYADQTTSVNDFTFKSGQLKSILNSNKASPQYQDSASNIVKNQFNVVDQAGRYAQKLARRSPQDYTQTNSVYNYDISDMVKKSKAEGKWGVRNSLQKYRIDKLSPASTFLPVKVSQLAPVSTPSATLPIQNIWHHLITKVVILIVFFSFPFKIT